MVHLTSSVLVAQVGEPPHVSESYSKAHAGHDEVHLSRPGFPLLVTRPRSVDHTTFFVLSNTSSAHHSTSDACPRHCQRDEAAISGRRGITTATAPIRESYGALFGLLQENQRAGGGWKSLLLHHSQNGNQSGSAPNIQPLYPL